ncbi:MAG TPA: hypothetical protein VFK06_20975, partial [Candidatus Angelobacter sp.]|nr:hypothetical protein [Candidatus Angelobacter sp.]
DGELETIDTTNWLPKVMRKDYIVGLTGQGAGVDPDHSLNLSYRCGGGFCQHLRQLADTSRRGVRCCSF